MVGFQSKNEGLPLVRSTRNRYPRPSSGQLRTSGLSFRNQGSSYYTANHRYRLAAAMDQAIRIDNRIFERRQEQQYNPRHSDEIHLQNTPVSRIHSSAVPQRFVDNYSRSPANQPSAPITSTPFQQHRTTDDMDIDFARRGPLTSA
ncbi:hypothetical protein BASA81_009247 [Batrachochytrium salamandrivorans]|nr:hypothetical protein BASA81_009247 [Batrachochytrium salamandrivorans]